MRTGQFCAILFVMLLMFTTTSFSQDATIDIWNGNTPNLVEGAENIQEVVDANSGGVFISKVSKPIIEVYLPPDDIATGTGVVICPGGGYSLLAWDYEGQDVARWFNTLGVAGFVLKYRLPETSIVDVREIAPIQDAHRALRYVRSMADAWHINLDQLGILGFSAGGHLAGTATVHADSAFSHVDAIDTLSAAPNFTILVYPVVTMDKGTHSGSRSNLLGSSPSQEMIDYYSVEKQITADTPPFFITVSSNDGTVEFEPNSLALYNTLQAASIPSELWVYEETLASAHGYGLSLNARETIEWPWRLALWMQANGWSTIVPDRPRYTFLNIDQTDFGFSSQESRATVHISCDSTWQVLADVPDWLSLDKLQGDKTDSLSFTASANASDTPRIAQIIIGHDLRQDTLQVLQAATNKYGQFLIGGTSPNNGEKEIINAALQAGFVMTLKTDNSLAETGIETENVDFVLISDTNVRNYVDNLYRDTNLPVMVMETGVLDKMGMTDTRKYGQDRDVDQLVILNDQHQLAAGLIGTQTVFTKPARMNWGTPGAAALNIATIGGDVAKSAIFAYEAGDLLADGSAAAGKRIGFFISSNSNDILTVEGKSLLQAALVWMLDKTSAVADDQPSSVPMTFNLQQNYPNPFNPSTTITYALPEKAHVLVQIYDVNGRLVDTLVDRDQQAGTFTISYHAAHLASGAYFCKLQAAQHVQVRKMLYIR